MILGRENWGKPSVFGASLRSNRGDDQSMDESTVFKKICVWLEDRDYRVFIDVPSQYHNHSEYDKVTDRWPHHHITISGYRPDVLGFTPSGRVFAVEVKGSKHKTVPSLGIEMDIREA